MRRMNMTVNQTKTKSPFRGDQVGSLLRPDRLHTARKDYKEGTITSDALRQVENEEIKRIVDEQIKAGLTAVTDGEFRRTWFHLDFMENINGFEGYVPEHGYLFKDEETEKYNIRNTGKISFNTDHPFLQDDKELIDIVDARAVTNFAIPSPICFSMMGSEIQTFIQMSSRSPKISSRHIKMHTKLFMIQDCVICSLMMCILPDLLRRRCHGMMDL